MKPPEELRSARPDGRRHRRSASDDESPQHVVERFLAEALGGSGRRSPGDPIASEAVRQRVARFRSAFPDLAVDPRLVLAEGSLVAAHMTARGTHRGTFQGIPATGRSWVASCTALYRVENGKVIDSWENWDLLSILEQLGGVQRAATASA